LPRLSWIHFCTERIQYKTTLWLQHKEIYDAIYGQLREIEVQKLQKALTEEQTIFSKVAVQNKAIIFARI